VGLLQFSALPLWVNPAIFGGAAVFVWVAGTRLAGYASALAARTEMSQAFLGMVVLGIATSLPEIATTVTAAQIGNARLVSGNLFGGVAMQVAVLAIVDLIAVRDALTYFTPNPVLLFQGVMLLLLLALALAGATIGEPLSLLGVGLTPALLVAGYLLTLRLSQGGDYLPRWPATNEPESREDEEGEERDSYRETTNRRLYLYAGLAGLVILAAGWALAKTGDGDALAEQTGLGSSFVGVSLVAVSTSLPELSATLSAVRRGNHEMAVSNILGTNCLEVALFFLADLCYRQGPILATTDRSALFAGTLGMAVTAIFLLGLLERRDRTVLGMGVDSVLVLVAYLAGIGGLYYLR
jgi:cation:H+ antiporter